MLTSIPPADWRDLQNKVATILSQCGFNTEVEKTIRHVRGEAEIDVYAEEEIRGRKYILLCECKNWQSRINQQIVHGFRTVVTDIGAHSGLIITTSDYQSGAFSAAEHTNIELFTWEQFLDKYEATWIENHFRPTITSELDPLMTYVEPLAPRWYSQLSEENKKSYGELQHKYFHFGYFALAQSDPATNLWTQS